MNKVLCSLFLSMLLMVSWAFAGGSRCPLEGNTYVFLVDDVPYAELSGFECTFGPGCEAECDLWWGDFDVGPLYHAQLPFVCEESGDIVIAGFPCALNSEGSLECLAVDTTGYSCITIGEKTWCLPQKPDEFQFDLE